LTLYQDTIDNGYDYVPNQYQSSGWLSAKDILGKRKLSPDLLLCYWIGCALRDGWFVSLIHTKTQNFIIISQDAARAQDTSVVLMPSDLNIPPLKAMQSAQDLLLSIPRSEIDIVNINDVLQYYSKSDIDSHFFDKKKGAIQDTDSIIQEQINLSKSHK
jgi:hypothetical protein